MSNDIFVYLSGILLMLGLRTSPSVYVIFWAPMHYNLALPLLMYKIMLGSLKLNLYIHICICIYVYKYLIAISGSLYIYIYV